MRIDMLKKLEFTFTDGKVNPTCHVVVQQETFDADGNSLGLSASHRATIDVATCDCSNDSLLKLSSDDEALIVSTVDEAKKQGIFVHPADGV
jgi:hypothetical protein